MSILNLLLFLLAAAQGRSPAVPETRPSAQKEAVLALYEVQDLANARVFDFEAPQLGVPRVGQDKPVPAREGRSEPVGLDRVEPTEPTPDQIESMARTLEQSVRSFIEPSLSSPEQNVRATKSGTLVVNGMPVQQEWVEQFLGNLRGYRGMVEVVATIYTTERGVLAQLGYAANSTLPPGRAAELKELLTKAGGEVVQAPKLLMFPCGRANIAVLNEMAYIQSWQLETVEPGAQVIADPQVARIQEGLTLDARVVPLPGNRFGAEVRVSACQIQRPIPTRKVRLEGANGREVEISEPQVKTARFESTVALVDGGSVVLVTQDVDPAKDLAAVITVRRVEAPRAETGK
jgi:hypothetical protein